MMLEFTILIVLIILNSFSVYRFYFHMIFKDIDDVNKSIRFTLTPDLFSLFRREYLRDRIGEFKLGLFIMLCFITTMIEYGFVYDLIMRIIRWENLMISNLEKMDIRR